MGEHIRTILLVTVVTALVWVFAEAESLRTQDTTIELVFEADRGSERVIDLIDPASPPGGPATFLPPGSVVEVTVQLEGSTGAIDTAMRRLRERSIKLSPGAEGVPSVTGENVLSLNSVLRGVPELRTLGVSIKRVAPESVRVFVDELGTREVPVSVITPGGDLDGPPETRPALVRITAPQRDLRAITEGSSAVAKVEPAIWSRLVPGRRETVPGIRLEPPVEFAGASRVRIDPPTADVSLTIRSRTASLVLPTVPVHLRVPPGELSKFDVDIVEQDRALIDVTVTGPAEVIRDLEAKTLRPIAYVSLSFEELERGIPSKEAVFTDLPTSLRFEVPNRNVRLRITRREDPAGANGSGKPN